MAESLHLTYNQHLLNISTKVEELALKSWIDRDWQDKTSYLGTAITLVEGGMSAVVSLVNAYFNQESRRISGDPILVGRDVDPSDFDIEGVRGASAEEVYGRPFGALAVFLSQGEDFAVADNKAGEYVRQLAALDMQLALTQSSAFWMLKYGNGFHLG